MSSENENPFEGLNAAEGPLHSREEITDTECLPQKCTECNSTYDLSRFRIRACRERTAAPTLSLAVKVSIKGIESLSGYVCNSCIAKRQAQMMWSYLYMPLVIGCLLAILVLCAGLLLFRGALLPIAFVIVAIIGMVIGVSLWHEYPTSRRIGELILFEYFVVQLRRPYVDYIGQGEGWMNSSAKSLRAFRGR